VDDRYSRQVLFHGLGAEGQAALGASRALLVGCGALGSLLAQILVRAGVGALRIADRDFVEPSNLQRQLLFDEDDARRSLPKAVAARDALGRINSGVSVEGIVADVGPGNIASLAEDCSLILDGSDNFEIRFLVNDYSVCHGVPWIYGAAVGSTGLVMPVLPGKTPCLRCVFEEAPPPGSTPTCDTAGVIAPVIGVVASLQAAEALKILSGHTAQVLRGLVSVDVWDGRLERFPVGEAPSASCPACAERRFEHLRGDRAASAAVLCGRRSVQITPVNRQRVDLAALAGRLEPLGATTRNDYLVRARLGEHEITVFSDGRAIIGGTTDEATARALYARYVGS